MGIEDIYQFECKNNKIGFTNHYTYLFIKDIIMQGSMYYGLSSRTAPIYHKLEQEFKENELDLFPKYSYKNNVLKIEKNLVLEYLILILSENRVSLSLILNLLEEYKKGLLKALAIGIEFDTYTINGYDYINKNIKFSDKYVFRYIYDTLISFQNTLKDSLIYLESYKNEIWIENKVLEDCSNIITNHIDLNNDKLLRINYDVLIFIFKRFYKNRILSKHYKKIIHFVVCLLHETVLHDLDKYIENEFQSGLISYDYHQNINYHQNNSYDDDYDGKHSFFNDPDYDDYTIREAFDGDPTLKWNID